jgi:hypothetical protein
MSSKSPFNDRLHTNYAPTSKEKADIEALCTDPLRDIQRLDEEINKLEEEMARLRLRRQELQTFVDDHRMLLSPIRQLSPEVLQGIFVECVTAACYPYYFTDRYPVMLAAQAPMLLGRVCSSWRRIAYSTPELWSMLHVAIPNPEKGEADSSLTTLRLGAVKDWLGRTGSLPLHISLFAAPSSRDPRWDLETGEQISIPHDYSHIYQYAEALMEFADRWGSLRLYVPPPLLRPWSVLSGRTLPMLKEFQYTHVFQYGEGFHDVEYTDYQVLEFLRQTPVESVTLSLVSPGHIPVFRKNALTYLDIRSGLAFSDKYSLAYFFSGFVSLHTLHFTFSDREIWEEIEKIGSDGRSGSELVTLPCLEKLNIFGLGDDHCCIVDFWHCIRAPNLQSMRFQLSARAPLLTNSHSHGTFARFMDISQCSILSIDYYTSANSFGDDPQSQELYYTVLMPYIRACIQVTDLTIRLSRKSPPTMHTPYLSPGEWLLRALFQEGDVGLLPHLRSLKLHIGLPKLNTKFLENITQSRASLSLGSAQVPLEQLEIHLPTPIEDSVRSQFGDGHSHAGTKIVIQAPQDIAPGQNKSLRTSPFAGLLGYAPGSWWDTWSEW